MLKRVQCARCKDWERLGLSRSCPSCDAEWLDAEAALEEYRIEGGKSLEQVKRELGLE